MQKHTRSLTNSGQNKLIRSEPISTAPVLENQIEFETRLDKFYKKPIEKVDTKYTMDTKYTYEHTKQDNQTIPDIQNIKTYKRTYKMTEDAIRKLQEMKKWYPIGTTFDQMINYAIMQIEQKK